MTYYPSFLFPVGFLSLESISCVYTKEIKVSSQHEVDKVSPGHPVSRLTNNCSLFFPEILSHESNTKNCETFLELSAYIFSSAGYSGRSVLRCIKMMDRKENFRTLFTQMFEEEDDDDEGHEIFST